MFLDYEHLNQEIIKHGLSDYRETIFSLVRPAVWMDRTPVDEKTLPLGASKLGGNPDVPEDFEWFYRGDKPLTFIGQFKLSEVANPHIDKYIPPEHLPRQMKLFDLDSIPEIPVKSASNILPEYGILYFFCNEDEQPWGLPEQRNAWRVFYVEDENIVLHRMQHPIAEGRYRTIEAPPVHRIVFRQRLSLPYALSREEYEQSFKKHNTDENYSWMLEQYRTLLRQTYFRRSLYMRNWNYMNGHALSVKGSISHLCAIFYRFDKQDRYRNAFDYRYPNHTITRLELESQRWEFLFQMSADLAFAGDDYENIYVCIPKESLREHRFEDCWLVASL